MPTLIFCAAKNKQYAQIAHDLGFAYGAKLPDPHIYFPPVFVDQDWLNPVFDSYMAALERYRPALASVLDWEHWDQLPEVLRWAECAAQFVTEAVIIIPKVTGGIEKLPRTIGSKQVRLGFSTPVKNPKTKFSGTGVPLREFDGWPIHILGGSPQKQYEFAHKGLKAASVDQNYIMNHARAGRFYAPAIGTAWKAHNKYFPQLKEAGLGSIGSDVPNHAFRLSCINIKAMWRGASCGLRYATEADIPRVKQIADQYKQEVGKVLPIYLREAIGRLELIVAEERKQIVGFVNYHVCRDGWTTVREIAVAREARGAKHGAALLGAVPGNVRLKAPCDNQSNTFYEHEGFKFIGIEPGRKRWLNVWEK